jgi:ribosomal protein S18 acetylase RimI-like enzyme
VIRRVSEADEATIRELWEEFEAEVPEPPSFEHESWEDAWADLTQHARDGVAVLAEDGGAAVGYAFAAKPERNGRVHVTDVYVRPRARREGLAKAMLREVVAGAKELGGTRVTLHVTSHNTVGHAVWQRLGFDAEEVLMGTSLDALERRLGAQEAPSSGSVYVQTDDATKIEAIARRFVPRLGRSERTEVTGPANGWVAVNDDLCDREPAQLQRLAKELSFTTGAVVCALGVERGVAVRYVLYERGSVVDEYLSWPEAYGPLPPGDVVALGANPRVVARLTGADPERVRRVARTATSPDDLPPADELCAELAPDLGVG